jgi:uncharacterized protein YneF (UPF0154 family)
VSVLWFLLGLCIGLEAGLLYGWLALRRVNRSMARVTAASEKALRVLRDMGRSPW